MKFDDRISGVLGTAVSPFDFSFGLSASLKKMETRLGELCFLLIHAARLNLCILDVAKSLRVEVAQMIQSTLQERRYITKLDMLRRPDWRMRVIKDLGGIDRLLTLFTRLREPFIPMQRRAKTLSPEEERRRAHIKLCAQACAKPYIRRDPFRVDQEGQFRLPPMRRGALPENAPKKAALQNKDYVYDARPVNNFRGIHAPIMVWPEEFMAFMRLDIFQEARAARAAAYAARQAQAEAQAARKARLARIWRRYANHRKWRAAMLSEHILTPRLPHRPRVKTARAPPPCYWAPLHVTPFAGRCKRLNVLA